MFSGSYVALVTPFHQGKVDLGSVIQVNKGNVVVSKRRQMIHDRRQFIPVRAGFLERFAVDGSARPAAADELHRLANRDVVQANMDDGRRGDEQRIEALLSGNPVGRKNRKLD